MSFWCVPVYVFFRVVLFYTGLHKHRSTYTCNTAEMQRDKSPVLQVHTLYHGETSNWCDIWTSMLTKNADQYIDQNMSVNTRHVFYTKYSMCSKLSNNSVEWLWLLKIQPVICMIEDNLCVCVYDELCTYIFWYIGYMWCNGVYLPCTQTKYIDTKITPPLSHPAKEHPPYDNA